MSEDFLKRSNMQKERRKNYKYNHRTSHKGYANLGEDLVKEKLPPSVDQATLWKHARVGKDGEFMNKEVEEIAGKIVRPCSFVVGKVDNIVATRTVFERISTDEIVYGVRLGEGNVQVLVELACDSHSLLPILIVGSIFSIHDAIGSHIPWPKYLITSSKKSRESEALKGTKSKMNEFKLPTVIRFVLRHVEKDTKDEYLTIPVDTWEIFGYSFNVNVMKDGIKQLCLMEELALSMILSYIICLYESDPSILEEYAFMNPGQILKGLAKGIDSAGGRKWLTERWRLARGFDPANDSRRGESRRHGSADADDLCSSHAWLGSEVGSGLGGLDSSACKIDDR
ncbi:uncharacterized protein E6C27_scaffold243G001620 [Cucumis melo var. makuwa]|uniref:DUF8039 domain-containing protein n=1 Tax=Cucumis melo var. makuwa TaxID=1194695 RepID=A0A5A7TWM1_CUCMM|nr:uncharacterized protein E6C27_scaffold243G001620 [Cucumis melo var. makuwa]